ncbi:hypothetical protein C0992_010624 [Termitomyces sp. T32_za158]|nr:hypothetical protein C0992_010624 [Termitomyces sp. T32_za158]
MKRGFLVDKNKTDKNKKPETPVAQSSQKVFAHPQYRYDTPGASPQADDEFKCTVMPPLPRAPLFQDTSGGGPYSLCLFNGRRQELAILSTPGFPSAVPKATQTRCRLGSSSDGIRMFAACRIDPGDLVVAERPLFLMPAAATGVPVKIPPSFQASPAQVMQLQMRQYNMMLEKCLNRLPPEDKNAFYEFKTHDRKEGLGPILDRMEMNGLSVVVTSADGKERFENSAIFKQVSRIRHRYGSGNNALTRDVTRININRGNQTRNIVANRNNKGTPLAAAGSTKSHRVSLALGPILVRVCGLVDDTAFDKCAFVRTQSLRCSRIEVCSRSKCYCYWGNVAARPANTGFRLSRLYLQQVLMVPYIGERNLRILELCSRE